LRPGPAPSRLAYVARYPSPADTIRRDSCGPKPCVLLTKAYPGDSLGDRCAECLDVWLPDNDERWQADFDTNDELVFFCPECAEREFGDT
jgi:hypothetical protein